MHFECERLIVRTVETCNDCMHMQDEDVLTFQRIVSARTFPPPRRTPLAPPPMAYSPRQNLKFSGEESSEALMIFSLT